MELTSWKAVTVAINLEDVVIVRGAQTLVNGFSAVIRDTDRVGLFGPNGCGKSSLLTAILGDLRLEAGRIALIPPEMTIGYLPQCRALPPDWTVLRALRKRTGVQAAELTLEECASRLAWDTSSETAADYDLALSKYISLGADSFDDRALAVLAELGTDVPLDRTCEGLSGGELARIGLAGIVLSRFDALLLDEPTNDLDEAGLSLLTEFVDAHSGPVLLVSHDRRFLESTITSVVEFDPYLDRVALFDGGYGAWQRERQRAHAAAVDEGEQYDESVAGLKEQIAASKRRSARGVRTAKRAYSEGSADKLLRNMMVDGATGLAQWFPDTSGMSAAAARTHLAKFGLGRDDVDRPMLTLSEGERTRVGLALLATSETIGLILDEPTNHLDLPAIEQLEAALAQYRGTLILVTHDEAFAEAIAFDRTIELSG